ncbi:MAG: FtsW/RodA/SpoVE family cell cycle protein [Brevefilum sp.]|nr:FtsW/RodA/SpoVE family cell cycle protein [Brevefilum sp.]MDT8381231.1 FtsW/RodA/SpoVE family cell cycle protein [Brevefilum sp.]MDW7753812.1 FtsW/RodA/SpoVE family cell cycle protein [Brevefilum sp.]
MGEGTYVRNKTRTNKNQTLRLPFDVPMLLVVVVLLVFGLLMVYSASWDFSLLMGREATYLFGRQILWVLLGIGTAVIASFINYHFYERILPFVGLGTLLSLFAVLIVNDPGGGKGTRMLLGGSIQPSEMAKAVIIIYLSFWLYNRKDSLNDVQIAYFPLILILGVTFSLIMLQPDLSAAITVLMMGVLLFFLAGGDWKVILLVVILVLLVGIPLMYVYPTGRERITSYLTSLNNPLESSYHIQRTLEAVVKGGWFGVGIGQADTKFTGLPLAPTDSIFAVIAEETGIMGGFIMVVLYTILIWRGFKIAKNAPDQLGALMAFGLTTWIGIEALMNMAVIVGLIPFTGNALPLISAGGSNMVVTLTSIGIIMNISRTSMMHKASERSPHSAVVDLRRRDGRGRVSRRNRS